jgi:glycosyltransferase involved in cell wall biosynthesis
MADTVETGLGRYARELVRRLPSLRPEWDFILIQRPQMAGANLGHPLNVRETMVSGYLDHPRNLLAGMRINRIGLDLYHSLHHFLPLGLRVRQVVITLHDLIWVEHPRLTFDTRHDWLKWRMTHLYGKATMQHAMAAAHHVVAISHHSAQRARTRYGLPPERVSIIHHGADHMLPLQDERSCGKKAEPFLLSVGNSKPYKNLRGLLSAFARVAPHHPELRLKMVGRGDSFHNLRALAVRLGIATQVQFCVRVAEAEMRGLFAGALALVFPSLIEGFGFPLVEAMALGCPVITSDIPVAREIVGNAALCVDPDRPESIAAAIEQVLADAELRRKLRLLGQGQASRFTWNDCAKRTAEVYHALLH